MAGISKIDRFKVTQEQADAGHRMWDRTGKSGRLAHSSMDAEATAPKTWLLWKNSHRGEMEAIIECEVYIAPRFSEHTEGVGTLHGMCPCCGETFIVKEDNKSMSLGWVQYGKAKGHLKDQWERHCREELRRRPLPEDKIAVVSSPERWQCAYCKEWCVKVTDSIAITDKSGATQIVVDMGQRRVEGDKVIPAVAIKENGIIL